MDVNRKSLLVVVALVIAWLAFDVWQYHEFRQQRERERADLVGQSEVLRQALLGGVRARRRLGRGFEELMQAVLDEVTSTPGVLAIRLDGDDDALSLKAGRADLLAMSDESPLWLPQGLQTTAQCDVRLLASGQGMGGGGPVWMRDPAEIGEPVRLQISLLMDRSATDQAIRGAAQLRLMVAGTGAALLAAVALAWLAAVRAIQVRAQNELLQSEKQRLEELSQAASGLAHETRNPLGVIRGGLQSILIHGQRASGDDQASKLQLLLEECDRVTSRINQFLAYARPQAASLEAVDTQALFAELQVLLQPDLEAKQLQLQVRADAACGVVLADANLLRQILFNLVQNAIAFSPAGEAIDVQMVKRQAGTVTIQVADRGSGVPAEEVGRLFSPYFTTRADGAGLGLAIVKRLALEQNWTVGYMDRSDGGSMFLIEGVRVAGKSANLDR